MLASTIFVSAILAGIYGIIHDQITYSISPEYFTKFKYVQFGFDPQDYGGHRPTVAIIGFLATWWTGIIIGIGLGLTALIYKTHKKMFAAIKKAILLVFTIAILTGLVGFFYGKSHLIKVGVNWWLPDNLVDKSNFIVVGSIHNFSYLGGLLGLLTGTIYLIVNKINQTRQEKLTS